MSSHHGKKTRIPPMADIAEMLRDQQPLDQIAAACGVTKAALLKRLYQSGYSASTGQPMETTAPPRPIAGQRTRTHPTDNLAGSKTPVACADRPDLFFPGVGGSKARVAKRLCATCPVEDQCREWALANREPLGVWGGTSVRDRRKILQEREQGVA